jgi:hypothetical protein
VAILVDGAGVPDDLRVVDFNWESSRWGGVMDAVIGSIACTDQAVMDRWRREFVAHAVTMPFMRVGGSQTHHFW